jgi:SAM-dependent methyltransferase
MPGCIVCGGPGEFVPVFKILGRCRACGFVTWPDALPDDPGQLYDEQYFSGGDYPNYVGNEASLRRSMLRHLDQMAPFCTNRSTLLEIGCAYGFFLDEARTRFDRVVGIDVAASAVERARNELGVEAYAGAFLELPLESASFDVVCLWDTVEHLARPDLFLQKARRLLRPDGRLFLTTGDISSLNARLRGPNWRQIHPPSHLHYFSRDSIGRLLERTGFRVLGFETAAYYHSIHNILATMAMRQGITSRLSRLALQTMGESLARRIGFWINLGDIIFVAAEKVGGPAPGRMAPTCDQSTVIARPGVW